MLSGIRDVDREILNKLDDRDLLNMCGLNQTYSERVCDDNYFRLRTEARFPKTVPYKDSVNPQRIRTWKNHYLTIVKYIDLLQRNYEYEYKKLDKSPELLYLARNLFSEYSEYDKDQALIYACLNGKLYLVKYLTETGSDVNANKSEPLIYASFEGHLEIVKYLVEHGANIHAREDGPLIYASADGHLEIVKYLVEDGANISAQDGKASEIARKNKHIAIVNYLYRKIIAQ